MEVRKKLFNLPIDNVNSSSYLDGKRFVRLNVDVAFRTNESGQIELKNPIASLINSI